MTLEAKGRMIFMKLIRAVRAFAPVLVAILFSVNAQAAKEVKFKEFPFEIARGEHLIVQGVRGTVRLMPLAPGKSPVVRARKLLVDGTKPGASEHFDALSFSVRREGGLVMIEPKGPSSRQDWIDWSRPGQPELSFEIEAPSTSAEVHLHSGTVLANGWKDALAVSLQDGKLAVSDGAGNVNATILRGDIKIEKQKGVVRVESHAAKVTVTANDGDVQVHNFGGETLITNVKGDVAVRSKTGTITLAKINGGVDFDNGRGKLEATAIDGSVRGVNDEGIVSFQLVGEADLSIETQDGPVAVKPPSATGVLLKLSSEDGVIAAPESIQVPRNSGPKSVVARLDGAPKGVIVLRSKRGTIRVR
ncbi:hypothetical protein BH10BDE1_BH10BDE1_14480 [soil metagenome]